MTGRPLRRVRAVAAVAAGVLLEHVMDDVRSGLIEGRPTLDAVEDERLGLVAGLI
jgi:hypothetical protein